MPEGHNSWICRSAASLGPGDSITVSSGFTGEYAVAARVWPARGREPWTIGNMVGTSDLVIPVVEQTPAPRPVTVTGTVPLTAVTDSAGNSYRPKTEDKVW